MAKGEDVQKYVLSGGRKSKAIIWDMCKQSGSLLLTGGAIVRNGYATLIAGPGTDNLLEATYRFPEQMDGIIGNGRSILFDIKKRTLYSLHSCNEVQNYFKESFSKRDHKHLMKSRIGDMIIIMNIESRFNKKEEYGFVEETELGKGIRISPPSNRRKRIRNFASKASHIRENDLFLIWKEKIPMCFEDIYDTIKKADMNYFTVTTPFYVGNVALMYVQLKKGKSNPHELVLKKLLDEKII